MLSKSDFKIASGCCKKLVYKKQAYGTSNDTNEYIEMLAQGGYIVSKYAQLMYTGGIEVKGTSLEESFNLTQDLIAKNKNIVLFEATLISNGKVIRVDILEKKGDELNIIEVKSKSHDSEDDASAAKKKLNEYIEDVAYQTLVAQELYPKFKITPFLLLPDKSKRTEIDGLAGWFEISDMTEESFEIDELPAQSNSVFKKPIVKFKHEGNSELLKKMQQDNLLTLLDVNEDVLKMKDIIINRTKLFIDVLSNGIKPEHFSINKNCKGCEFNLSKIKESNGYRECWQCLSPLMNWTKFENQFLSH